ncbi:MAG TPA: hypothetical protein VF797_17040 [Noviherbaspirillum sp.]
MNIQAGIAYLLMRLAKFGMAIVIDPRDPKVYDIVVSPGDTFEKIARVSRPNRQISESLDSKSDHTMGPADATEYRDTLQRG